MNAVIIKTREKAITIRVDGTENRKSAINRCRCIGEYKKMSTSQGNIDDCVLVFVEFDEPHGYSVGDHI